MNGLYAVSPVASVPQTKSPAALVSTESHEVSVFTLRPPVKICTPFNDDVADAPSAVAETGPAKVEDAVPVETMYPVWRPRIWNPERSAVDVAVEVAMERCSMTDVDDATSAYGTFVAFKKSAVVVAEVICPAYVPCVNASYDVRPVASVPQTIEPNASVSSACVHDAMVGILMPPVSAVMPAKVEVAVAPKDCA